MNNRGDYHQATKTQCTPSVIETCAGTPNVQLYYENTVQLTNITVYEDEDSIQIYLLNDGSNQPVQLQHQQVQKQQNFMVSPPLSSSPTTSKEDEVVIVDETENSCDSVDDDVGIVCELINLNNYDNDVEIVYELINLSNDNNVMILNKSNNIANNFEIGMILPDGNFVPPTWVVD